MRVLVNAIALGSLGATTACSVATPLPLTPIQVIEGTWPAKTATVTTASKSYSIVGDTFSYKQLGFSITRASQKDWEFIPANNAVVVRYRAEGAEPRPTLSVQLLPLNTATFDQDLATVEADLKKNGVADITKADRTVAGVKGTSWTFDQKDTSSAEGIEVSNLRIYVPVQGSQVGDLLALVSAQAASSDFDARQADFDKMIDSIVLPVAPAAQ
jgi:hypothetical protein